MISFSIEAVIIFLHFTLAGHEDRTVRVLGNAFNLTRELSLGTLWSAVLALMCGAFAFANYKIQKKSGQSNPKNIAGWLMAAILFVTIAIDDSIGFHERLGAITSLELMKSFQYQSYPWHVTVAPFFAVSFGVTLALILSDVRKIPGLLPMLCLAMGCFGMALGLDYLEGLHQMSVLMSGHQAEEAAIKIEGLMFIEEALEIAGTTLFLYVFTSVFANHVRHVSFLQHDQKTVVDEPSA